MGERLRLEYENADEAMRTLTETRDDFEAAQLGLRSQVRELSAQFKGKSAQKFLSWWSGTGDKHWGSIVEHVSALHDKLELIKLSIQSVDGNCAERFKYEVQIEQPGGQP